MNCRADCCTNKSTNSLNASCGPGSLLISKWHKRSRRPIRRYRKAYQREHGVSWRGASTATFPSCGHRYLISVLAPCARRASSGQAGQAVRSKLPGQKRPRQHCRLTRSRGKADRVCNDPDKPSGSEESRAEVEAVDHADQRHNEARAAEDRYRLQRIDLSVR